VAGHAYPWDVLGDPDFPGRVRDLGIGTVTLAAAYHSARAATPLHPAHQTVLADHAALYRPVRPSAWTERRLTPLGPQSLDAAVRAEAVGKGSTMDGLDVALAERHTATDMLRAEVLAAVRQAAPNATVTLHGHPDPWATGASPGLTASAPGDVDAVLVPCWPT